MAVQKIRWSRVYESSEEELVALLKARNIRASRVMGEASSQLSQQVAQKGSTIWCAEGSLSVRTESTSTSLQPGDAIRIDAQTTYDVHAGISGYVYYISA